MELYPSLKKFPKVVPNPKEEKAFVPKGMIRRATYELRLFKESFKPKK